MVGRQCIYLFFFPPFLIPLSLFECVCVGGGGGGRGTGCVSNDDVPGLVRAMVHVVT